MCGAVGPPRGAANRPASSTRRCTHKGVRGQGRRLCGCGVAGKGCRPCCAALLQLRDRRVVVWQQQFLLCWPTRGGVQRMQRGVCRYACSRVGVPGGGGVSQGLRVAVERVCTVCVCVSVEVFLGGWVGVLCAVDEGKGVRCIHTVSRCHAAFGICELRGVEVCC